MNLINEEITHPIFGVGNITDHDKTVITVDFSEETKKFVYPDAIGKFIILNNPDTAKSFDKIISKKEMEQEALEAKREEERRLQALEQHRIQQLKNHKIHESSQVVFWLDEEEQQSVFTEWQLTTGEIQSGQNKGQPHRAARLRNNSASLLTVRHDDQPEEERRIVGLYMISETFTEADIDTGIVPAHEEFRIQLSEQESEQMLFWNYYINKNFPHQMTWNSGKYRYYDNEWTAQILRDIIALKTDEEEIAQADKFLDYFCQANLLDIGQIEPAGGALKQY